MTIKQLANISGVTLKTLRYYDNIGLLVAKRNGANGYRIYQPSDLDRLLSILLYRACGFPLSEIKARLSDPNYNNHDSLLKQKNILQQQKAKIDDMLVTIDRCLQAQKGNDPMTNEEKFKSFQQQKLAQNEELYGKEIRKRYGTDAVEALNQHHLTMDAETTAQSEYLDAKIKSLLEKISANASQDEQQQLATAHRDWLKLMWGKAVPYSKEAHLSLIDTYLADSRFLDYYGGLPAVEYLRAAVELYG